MSPMDSTEREVEAGLPAGFLDGVGRRRFEFMRKSLGDDMGLHLPELTDERRHYLAGQFAARVMRDERDAFLTYPVPHG